MQTFHTVKYSKIAQKRKSGLTLFKLKNVARNVKVAQKLSSTIVICLAA